MRIILLALLTVLITGCISYTTGKEVIKVNSDLIDEKTMDKLERVDKTIKAINEQ